MGRSSFPASSYEYTLYVDFRLQEHRLCLTGSADDRAGPTEILIDQFCGSDPSDATRNYINSGQAHNNLREYTSTLETLQQKNQKQTSDILAGRQVIKTTVTTVLQKIIDNKPRKLIPIAQYTGKIIRRGTP